MAYITPQPNKILTTHEGRSCRFYPYPKESVIPKGISEIARATPGFGFIIKDCKALYGNNLNGVFTPTRSKN